MSFDSNFDIDYPWKLLQTVTLMELQNFTQILVNKQGQNFFGGGQIKIETTSFQNPFDPEWFI